MRRRYILLDVLTLFCGILLVLGLLSESSVPVFLGKSSRLWAATIFLGCIVAILLVLRWRFDRTLAAIGPILNQAAAVAIIAIVLWEVVAFTCARHLPVRVLLNTPDWVKAVLPETVFERSNFRTGRTDEIVDDPLFGLRYAARLNVVNRRGDLSYRVITDSYGFPNMDESLYKGADVVVAGDSITMGSGVEFEEAWPQQLSKTSGLRVLNLGHGTWDVYQYPLVLERYAREASPRTVIVTLWTWNDMQARFYEYEDYRSSHTDVRGFRDYSLQVASPLELKAGPSEHLNYLEHAFESSGRILSFVTPFTIATISFLRSQILPAPVCEFTLNGRKLEFQFRPYLWETKRPIEGDYFHNRITRDFARIRNASAQSGATELYFIYVPALEEVYIPLLGQAKDLNNCARTVLAAHTSGRYDFGRYFSRYEEAARREGLEILDVTSFLQERAAIGEKLTWTDDSHPNALGHRRIADYVLGVIDHSKGHFKVS